MMKLYALLSGCILLLPGFLSGCRTGSVDMAESGSQVSYSTQREVMGSEPGRPFSSTVKIGRLSTRNGMTETIGETLYVSGQVGIDPVSGEPVSGDIKAETRQVLENLKNAVERAEFSLADAVQCTVFLADLGDYAAMNEVYLEYFPEQAPTRACVGVKELVRGLHIEISLIAER